MIKQAYIHGFLYKLAQYGINPEAIYGKFNLDDDTGTTSIPHESSYNIDFTHKPRFDLSRWFSTSKIGRGLFNTLKMKSLYGPRFIGLSYSRRF